MLTSNLDLFATLARPPYLTNPYPLYAWLRKHDPVHIDPDGTVYLSRYRHTHLLKHPVLRDQTQNSDSLTIKIFNSSMVKANRPRHTHLRRVAQEVFHRDAIATTTKLLSTRAHRLLDTLSIDSDLHTDYSQPLAVNASATLYGIPDDDVPYLYSLPGRAFQALYPGGDVDDADDASQAMYSYFANAIRQRDYFTADMGFARMLKSADQLPFDDVVGICWLVFLGSYASSTSLIDLALINLLRTPHETIYLTTHTGQYLEEVLRFCVPHVINSANLTTTAALEIDNITLPADTPVRFMLAAINRDEEAFDDPDLFQPLRNGPGHVAFGSGIHACIGQLLARHTLTIGLTAFATRFPGAILSGTPTYRSHATQRLVTRLPARLKD